MSKSEASEHIEKFFESSKGKTPKEVKKIKRLAMKHKIPLKEKRKLFCKHCMNLYEQPSIKIKNNKIRIECDKCEKISRWRIK